MKPAQGTEPLYMPRDPLPAICCCRNEAKSIGGLIYINAGCRVHCAGVIINVTASRKL